VKYGLDSRYNIFLAKIRPTVTKSVRFEISPRHPSCYRRGAVAAMPSLKCCH